MSACARARSVIILSSIASDSTLNFPSAIGRKYTRGFGYRGGTVRFDEGGGGRMGDTRITPSRRDIFANPEERNSFPRPPPQFPFRSESPSRKRRTKTINHRFHQPRSILLAAIVSLTEIRERRSERDGENRAVKLRLYLNSCRAKPHNSALLKIS